MINDLDVPSSNGIFKYVDDTTIHEVVKKGDRSRAQDMINEVNKWSKDNKFELHSKKCKELRISFSRSPRLYDATTTGEICIATVDTIKILGVTLQSNLKWNSHTTEIIKKSSRRLYFLLQLKRAHVNEKELVKFYTTCIQPVLLYACQAFHYSLPEYINSSLERVQKRALRIIFGYHMSYSELLNLAELCSLDDRREELCQSFFRKIVNHPQGSLYNLIPFNTSRPNTTLRNIKPMYIPLCKTNRFKNSFIPSASVAYNNSHSQ